MKKLVMYFSLYGKTKKIAETKYKDMKADLLVEVKETKKRSKFNVMVSGRLEAMQGKKSEIEPLNINFSEYGTIVIFMPLWGGNPAPALNSIIDLIPEGKQIELYITSAKGESVKSADNTSNQFQKRGSLVTKYVDLKIG